MAPPTEKPGSLQHEKDLQEDHKEDVDHAQTAAVPSAGNASLFKELWELKRMWMYLLIIYLSVINVGIDAGLGGLSLGIPSFRRQFGRYYDAKSGYVIKATYTSAWSGASVGAQTIGAMFSGYVADRIGRKWALSLSAIITIIATVIEITARNIGPLIAGKTVMGLGIGFLVAQSPAYLAEMSPPRLRGIVVLGVNFFLVFGQWLSSAIIWGCASGFPDINDNTSWLLVFGIQFIFPVIYLALVFVLPESPVYLIQKRRHEEARINVAKLFGSKYDGEAHVQNIIKEVHHENESRTEEISFLEPLKNTDLRRTLLGTLVFVGQLLVGNLFVLGYQNYFYELAGISNGNAITFGNYCISLVGNVLSYFVVESVGRRPLYVYGCVGLGISNFLVGFMSLVQDKNRVIAGDIAILGLSLWALIYQCCVGPPAWAYNGELPSNRLRAKTNSWSNLVNSLVSFGISYSIPALFNPDAANLGLKMGYIFGALSMVLAVLTWFVLPETKGRTNWQIDALFENKVPARRFKGAEFDRDQNLIMESVGKPSAVA